MRLQKCSICNFCLLSYNDSFSMCHIATVMCGLGLVLVLCLEVCGLGHEASGLGLGKNVLFTSYIIHYFGMPKSVADWSVNL